MSMKIISSALDKNVAPRREVTEPTIEAREE
jgi:hypothetical protein